LIEQYQKRIYSEISHFIKSDDIKSKDISDQRTANSKEKMLEQNPPDSKKTKLTGHLMSTRGVVPDSTQTRDYTQNFNDSSDEDITQELKIKPESKLKNLENSIKTEQPKTEAQWTDFYNRKLEEQRAGRSGMARRVATNPTFTKSK